MGFGEK